MSTFSVKQLSTKAENGGKRRKNRKNQKKNGGKTEKKQKKNRGETGGNVNLFSKKSDVLRVPF